MRLVYILAIALFVGFVLFGCTGTDYKAQPNISGKPAGGATAEAISDSDLAVLDISPSEPDAGDELGLEVPE